MSLELLSADQTDEGLAVTFATDRGVERLVGTPDEMAAPRAVDAAGGGAWTAERRR